MKKLKEVLRLKFEGQLKNRQIAGALQISAGTVSYYVRAALDAKVDWALAVSLDEQTLISRLLPFCRQRMKVPQKARYMEPDYAQLHHELKRKGVNLQLLWEEYKAQAPEQSYSYAQFCRRYHQFCNTLKPSLRQRHTAGEACFMDYCGPTIPIYHPDGTVHFQALIFIAAMGASHYTFARAYKSRRLPDWLDAQQQLFVFLGGVPAILVPDNEKAGVKQACYYDPELNPTYADFARYYQTSVIPTRPYKPKDKATVEKAVQVAETWIIARLRTQRFYSLHELNQAICPLLATLNERAFKKLPGCRRSVFEALDKPALKPLPKEPYVFATFKVACVSLDYHVQLYKHYYSVPFTLVGKKVDCRITLHTVEISYQGQPIACHKRDDSPGQFTTLKAHMPATHLYHQHWTPQHFQAWAKTIGQSMAMLAQQLLAKPLHAEHIRRLHNGFRHLAKQYGAKRLESACHYAYTQGLSRHRDVHAVLLKGLDLLPIEAPAPVSASEQHEHIRGPYYFSHPKE